MENVFLTHHWDLELIKVMQSEGRQLFLLPSTIVWHWHSPTLSHPLQFLVVYATSFEIMTVSLILPFYDKIDCVCFMEMFGNKGLLQSASHGFQWCVKSLFCRINQFCTTVPIILMIHSAAGAATLWWAHFRSLNLFAIDMAPPSWGPRALPSSITHLVVT